MAEYIERGTAIAKLTALEVSKPNATIVSAKRLLAEIPAADVAPVVRCKDCQKFKTYACRMVASGYNDFCSYGERKDGDPI